MTQASPTAIDHTVTNDNQIITPEHIASLVMSASESGAPFRKSYDGYLAREIGAVLKQHGWTPTSPDGSFTNKIRASWLISPDSKTKVCFAEGSFLGAFTDISTMGVRP